MSPVLPDVIHPSNTSSTNEEINEQIQEGSTPTNGDGDHDEQSNEESKQVTTNNTENRPETSANSGSGEPDLSPAGTFIIFETYLLLSFLSLFLMIKLLVGHWDD